MTKAFDDLTQASHRLAEEMYKKPGEAQGGGAEPGGGGAAGGAQGDSGVVDADFEEVK
jgi:molecular chaperone DnaK